MIKRWAAYGLQQTRRLFGSRRGRSFDKLSDYLRKTPTVGYVGWVGRANLGDEALHDAFVKLFPGLTLISTNDPLPVEMSLHAAIVRGGKPFDAMLLGGGTLIFHKEYAFLLKRAQSKGLPTAVFGTGVIDVGFWSKRLGELGYDPVQDDWAEVLHKADYIGVRGPESLRMLSELNLDGLDDIDSLGELESIGDPALSVCPEIDPAPRERQRRLAFNTGNIGPAWGDQAKIERNFGTIARMAMDRGWGVDFFGMHAVDRERAEAVIRDSALDGVGLWSEYNKTALFLEQLNRYDIVVSQKLHGVVLAAGLGIPCISIAYEPKCIDFMKSIKMGKYVVRADQFDPETVMGLVTEIDANYESIRETIRKRVNHWRACQQRSAQSLIELIGTATSNV